MDLRAVAELDACLSGYRDTAPPSDTPAFPSDAARVMLEAGVEQINMSRDGALLGVRRYIVGEWLSPFSPLVPEGRATSPAEALAYVPAFALEPAIREACETWIAYARRAHPPLAYGWFGAKPCLCGALDPNNTSGTRTSIVCPRCDG